MTRILRRLRSARLTPALVVACVALAMAVIGTAVASNTDESTKADAGAGDDRVTVAQKSSAAKAAKGRRGPRGPAGPQGPAGPPGQQGVPGQNASAGNAFASQVRELTDTDSATAFPASSGDSEVLGTVGPYTFTAYCDFWIDSGQVHVTPELVISSTVPFRTSAPGGEPTGSDMLHRSWWTEADVVHPENSPPMAFTPGTYEDKEFTVAAKTASGRALSVTAGFVVSSVSATHGTCQAHLETVG